MATQSENKKALVTARFTPAGVAILEPFLEVTRTGYGMGGSVLKEEELIHLVKDLAALVVELDPVTKAVMDAAPKLEVIGSCRGTPNNVDVAEATRRGIPVVFTPGRNAVSVAELALTLMLMLARRLLPAIGSLRQGVWGDGDDAPFIKYRGVELYGKTLSLVGCGAIGVEVAQRGRLLGMQVLVYDPYVSDAAIGDLGARRASLEEAVAQADFLSLHAKLTDSTRGILSRELLGKMKKSAYLINTAGGGLVDEPALVEALRSKSIAGAGLDVFSVEPIPGGHPLLSLDNVIATPHIGGATSDVTNHQAVMMAEDVKRVLNGERPRHLYNPEALEKK